MKFLYLVLTLALIIRDDRAASQRETKQTTICTWQTPLLLEDLHYQYYETGREIYIRDEELIVLANFAKIRTENIFKREQGWAVAQLTKSGFVANVSRTDTAFGKLYHRRRTHVYVPNWRRDDDRFRVEKRYLERVIVRGIGSVKAVVLVDDSNITNRLNLPSTTFLLVDLSLQAHKKSTVGFIALKPHKKSTRRNKQILINYLTSVNPSITIREYRSNGRDLSNTITERVDFYPVRAREDLPSLSSGLTWETAIAWHDDTLIRLACAMHEMQENAIRSLADFYVRHSFWPEKLMHVYDVLDELKINTKYVTDLDDAVRLCRRLYDLLEVTSSTPNFDRLIRYMRLTNAVRRPEKHILGRFRNILKKITRSYDKTLAWNEYREKVFDVFKYDNDNALKIISLEKIRAKLPWPKSLTEFQEDDLRSIVTGMRVDTECVDDMLVLRGNVFSFKTIIDKVNSSKCEFTTVMVVALTEVFIDEDLRMPGVNFLIYSPTWSIAKEQHVDLSADPQGTVKEGGSFLGYGVRFNNIEFLSLTSLGAGGDLTDLKSVENGKCKLNEDAIDEVMAAGVGGEVKITKSKKPLILRINNNGGNDIDVGDDGRSKVFCPDGTFGMYQVKNLSEVDANWKVDRVSMTSVFTSHFVEAIANAGSPLPPGAYRFYLENEERSDPFQTFVTLQGKLFGKTENRNVKTLIEYEKSTLDEYLRKKDLQVEDKVIANYLLALGVIQTELTLPPPRRIINLEDFFENVWSDVRQLKTSDNLKTRNEGENDKLRSQISKFESYMTEQATPAITSALRYISRSLTYQYRNPMGKQKARKVESLAVVLIMLQTLAFNECLDLRMGTLRTVLAAHNVTLNRIRKLAIPELYEENGHHEGDVRILSEFFQSRRRSINAKKYNEMKSTFRFFLSMRKIICMEGCSLVCEEIDSILDMMREEKEKCVDRCDYLQLYRRLQGKINQRILILSQEYMPVRAEQPSFRVLPNAIKKRHNKWYAVFKYRWVTQVLHDLFPQSVAHLPEISSYLTERSGQINDFVTEYQENLLEVFDSIHESMGDLLNGTYATLKFVNPVAKLFRNLKMWFDVLLPTADSMIGLGKEFKIINRLIDMFLSVLRSSQRIQVEKHLNAYVRNINLNKVYETEIENPDSISEIKEADQVLRSELIADRIQDAKSGLMQFLFPFAHEFRRYWDAPKKWLRRGSEDLAKSYENTVVEMLGLKSEFSSKFSYLDQYVMEEPFDPDRCQQPCSPFSYWPFSSIIAKNSFLSGRTPLNLYANIFRTNNTHDALKGTNFRIRFVPHGNRNSYNWNDDIREIQESLSRTSVELEHGGDALTRYADNTYRMHSEILKFVHDFRIDGRTYNNALEKFLTNDFTLSPFATWTVRLKHETPEQAIRLLKIRDLIGGIELVGDGFYVRNYPGDLKMNEYYQPYRPVSW